MGRALAIVLVTASAMVPIACGLEITGTGGSAVDGGVAESGAIARDGAPATEEDGATPPPPPCKGLECPCDLDAGQCPEAGTDVTLTLNAIGSATAGVLSTTTPALSCPGMCTSTLPAGTSVVVTAAPSPDETLVGWSIPTCGRDLTCTVSVNGPLVVTATFASLVHYAHAADRLWSVNGATGAVVSVGQFAQCGGNPTAYDMAIDRTGKAVVATSNGLYNLSLATASCGNNQIGSLGAVCNGLTFMPDPAAPQNDMLLAACADKLYRVNRLTATRTEIGPFGGSWVISGDLVWVPGKGLFATVNDGGNDYVAKVNPQTGQVTAAKDTGEQKLYGLGWRGGDILAYGAGKSYVVDVSSGTATELNGNTTFDGAGGASFP